MSKETSVIILGALVFIVPQLGIPSPWRTVLLSILALVLIVIGLYLRSEARSRSTGRPGQSYVENTPSSLPGSHGQDGINSLN